MIGVCAISVANGIQVSMFASAPSLLVYHFSRCVSCFGILNPEMVDVIRIWLFGYTFLVVLRGTLRGMIVGQQVTAIKREKWGHGKEWNGGLFGAPLYRWLSTHSRRTTATAHALLYIASMGSRKHKQCYGDFTHKLPCFGIILIDRHELCILCLLFLKV